MNSCVAHRQLFSDKTINQPKHELFRTYCNINNVYCTDLQAATICMKRIKTIQSNVGKHQEKQLQDMIHQGNNNQGTTKHLTTYRAKANNICL